jgi:tetratricopeptide (TPR) repeat protein
LSHTNPDQQQPAPPVATTEFGSVEVGVSVRRQLKGTEVHSYEVSLLAGQYIHAVADQQGIDILVKALAPDGPVVAQIDRPSGFRGPEALSFIAKTSGRHGIQISSLEKRALPGWYVLQVREVREPRPEDDIRIAAERAVNDGEVLRNRAARLDVLNGIEKFREALAGWEALGDKYEQAVALYGMGWGYRQIGDNHLAIEYFTRGLALMRAVGDRHGEAVAVTGLAWAHLYFGDTETSLDHFATALSLHRSLENTRNEAVVLHGIGWANSLLGRNHEALEGFHRSRQLRQAANDYRGEALTLLGTGKVLTRLGRPVEARDYLNRALTTLRAAGDISSEADTLSEIGWAHAASGNYDQALDVYDRALSLRRTVGDRAGEATTLYGMARIALHKRDLITARERMYASLEIIETLRTKSDSQSLRISYLALVRDYYDFLIDVLMRLHQTNPTGHFSESALRVSERARARALLDVLGDARSDSTTAQTVTGPLSVTDIQQQVLDDESLLLEYALGEERSYLWVVSRTQVSSYALPGRATVEALAQKVYDLLTARNARPAGESSAQRRARIARADAEFPASAAALSRMLLGPATPHLGKKRLLIVAEGGLQYITFGTLPSPNVNQPSVVDNAGASGPLRATNSAYRPLILDHEIVYAQSASTIAVFRADAVTRKRAPKTIAVIADPVFSADDERLTQSRPEASSGSAASGVSSKAGQRAAQTPSGGDCASSPENCFPRLFGTRWEAEQILAMVPPPDGTKVLDFAASRSFATGPELSQYRILHFATHALPDDNHPELSSVVLSMVDGSGASQDGLLRAIDISSLRLPAELTVLSACRTALGKQVRGEGLLGLTRAFMSAGVPRVVVSHWSVEDAATTQLMVRFYRRLLASDRPHPSAALRAAQIEMLKHKRWDRPYFWGAFVLQGEPR